jgi:hypothetical protein
MTEKLLHFIWQFQYFNRSDLRTSTGELITIVYPGRLNNNQGPDFLDAKIRIGDALLAGSVELHLETSDWNKHGHSRDANYKNVILHVVLQHDELFQNPIPVLELHHRIPTLLLDKYAMLLQESVFIPCASSIAQTRELTWLSWKERLVAERLSRKSNTVFQIFEQTGQHWEETFWRLLARTFGSKVNADAFEEIAQTISLSILAKHRNSIHQLEALLLGQANLLSFETKDDYTKLLQREYAFLKTKFALIPIRNPVHFLRMRPGNFPTVRLAQLAMLIHTSTHLFSRVLEETDLKQVKTWLQVTANDYWHYHYQLDEPSGYKPKNIGSSMAENTIINTMVPVLFAYGLYHNQEVYKEKAVRWLQELAPESNTVTDNFVQLAIPNKTDYDSQALLELKHAYCDQKRCLQCAVGNALLKNCL